MATTRPSRLPPSMLEVTCQFWQSSEIGSIDTHRSNHCVEVTYELDAKRFDEVQRIVHIIFGMQS